MPKVTVVIPSYNHDRFLEQRILSVLAQTYPDFDVLFLDDASTDDSLKVFAKYQGHPRIRSILNETNSGSTFKQWNKGVRAARGEYVWFAESDDVAEPRFLETLVRILDENPAVGLAYSDSLYIDDDGTPFHLAHLRYRELHPTRWEGDYVNRGADECLRYLIHLNTIPNASAVVFRKALYERVGYADETMTLCGDWSMWVKLLLVSDVAYVAAPLNRCRLPHPRSVRGKTAGQRLYLEEHLRIVRLICSSLFLPAGPGGAGVDSASDWLDQALRATESILSAAALQMHELAERQRRTEAAVHDLAARVAEQADRMRFWNRLRGLLLPQGGWRHRLARGLARLLPRKAA